MFLPMMRTERGSSTLPPWVPCPRPLPCLQNKVSGSHRNHMQTSVDSVSWSLLSFCCRSLVLQQSPVQVPRPRPPYSDLASTGLAQQPDETAHPLPFPSHAEWVHGDVNLQQFICSFFMLKLFPLVVHSAQWGTQNDAGEETSESGVTRSWGRTSCPSILNLWCQTSSHCSYVLILCLQCGRQGTPESLLSLGKLKKCFCLFQYVVVGLDWLCLAP